MGRVGSALDNAAAESFYSSIKVEYIHRHCFATRAEARLKIATWIADFFSTGRRDSAAGDWLRWSSNEPSPRPGRGRTRRTEKHKEVLHVSWGLTGADVPSVCVVRLAVRRRVG